MRIEIAVLFGSCVALAGAQAWSQVPGPPPPGATPTADSSAPAAPAPNGTAVSSAGAGAVPAPSAPPATPPSPLSPPDPSRFPPFVAPSVAPPAPPSPPSPPPEAPLLLAHRFGFGFGIWAAPIGLANQGSLGAAAYYGGSLGVRWWATERILVVPALRMGISYTTAPDSPNYVGETVKGSSYTNGNFSPSVSLGLAAYRGKSSRFILLGGLSFDYQVDETITRTKVGSTYVSQYEPVESVSFGVPAGFAFEQFFTPKLSISLGAGASLFSYGYTKTGHDAPSRFIGADFSTAQLTGSVFFYTD